MKQKWPIFLVIVLSLGYSPVIGQKLSIQDYHLSYRVFEVESVGNNPTTIASFLKDPQAYLNFLNTLSYNGILGNGGIDNLQTFYAGVTLGKNQADSRFWKKYTIETALFLTKRSRTSTGALTNQYHAYSPDTVYHDNRYSLYRNIQFFGGLIGLNRHFRISGRFQFFIGLYLQGGLAVVHHYNQSLDSNTYQPSTKTWTYHSTVLPDLAGTNYFQWRVMIPLGIEYAIIKQKLHLRFELDPGITGSRYVGKTFADRESHGFGLTLLYKPVKKSAAR
jgi:hypothetical protein